VDPNEPSAFKLAVNCGRKTLQKAVDSTEPIMKMHRKNNVAILLHLKPSVKGKIGASKRNLNRWWRFRRGDVRLCDRDPIAFQRPFELLMELPLEVPQQLAGAVLNR